MQIVIECYMTETTAQILSNYYYCSVISRENIFQEQRLITTSSYVNRCLTFFVSYFICLSTILSLIYLSSPFNEEGAKCSSWAISRFQALVCIQQKPAIIQITPVSSFKGYFWKSAKSVKQFLSQSFNLHWPQSPCLFTFQLHADIFEAAVIKLFMPTTIFIWILATQKKTNVAVPYKH